MFVVDVHGAFVNLVGSNVRLDDNTFHSGLVTAFSTVTGAEVYHNVIINGLGALNLLPGATLSDTVEGWSNVNDASLVENELALRLRAPADPTHVNHLLGDDLETIKKEGNAAVTLAVVCGNRMHHSVIG